MDADKKQGEIAFEFRNVSKNFGSVCANSDLSFQVKKGSIRALIGENGAGKSTAMNILFGLYPPDSGEVFVNGKNQRWASPADAITHGIGMVHQHFMLAHTATGLDNIILGDEEESLKIKSFPKIFNIIDRHEAKKKIQGIAKKYGLECPLDTKISKVSVGNQQRIEILKLLYRHAEILILDEPTAVLLPAEVDQLFENLRRLKNEGKTIIIVTHKVNEILSISDDITVFRSGHIVGEMKTSDANEHKIATLMIGREINLHPAFQSNETPKEKILAVENLNIYEERNPQQRCLNDVSFQVAKGEIVGIAGVEGNGQSDLINVLLHPRDFFKKSLFSKSKSSGQIILSHKNLKSVESLLNISGLPVGYLPEDRHLNGLLLHKSALDNFILGRQNKKPFSNGFFLHKDRIRKFAKELIQKFDIRPRNVDLKMSHFSGGNQQKLVIAREFSKDPKFIIAANPTRGVDIGAIEFIHEQIIAQRDKGAGVLLISTELDEILKLSDRILVFYEGRIVANFTRENANERELGLAMCGAVGG